MTKDASIFEFETPDSTKPLNLTTCAYLVARAYNEEGKEVVRPYTPLSTNNIKGKFEVLIKIYPNGEMTQLLDKLTPGDMLDFRHGEDNIIMQYPFKKSFIGMLAFGTGITPMIQSLHPLLGNKKDTTEAHLLYSNKTENEIIGKEAIDEWANVYERFNVTHVLTREPEDSMYQGHRGRITEEMIKDAFPSPDNNVLILFAGPRQAHEDFCGKDGILRKLGYSSDQIKKC